MSLLYEFRYFYLFAQICGFLPYTVDVNHDSRRVEGLAFRKNRPVFVWFSFLVVTQIFSIFTSAYGWSIFWFEREVYLKDVPFAVSALAAWSAFTWYILLFAIRLMALQLKCFQRMTSFINKLDMFMKQAGIPPHSRNSVKTRTIVAIVLVSASVKSFNMQLDDISHLS